MVKRIEELKSEGAELLVDKNVIDVIGYKNNKYVLIYDYSEDKTTIFDMKCNGNYVNYIYGKIKELNYEDVVYYIENK